MARLSGFESQRLFGALLLVVMTLFVAAGMPGAGRWRRPLRLAAIIGFAAALALALAEIGRWLAAAAP